ncbi:MAG: hypothetical protein ACFFBD_11465 [Candidatus Hodarchaeota archaeon]
MVPPNRRKPKNRRRKADKTPPELYMVAQIQEQTVDGLITIPLRIRRPKQEELFAVALKNLGNYRFRVQCSDGLVRIARLRGGLVKRNWVRIGDLVLVEPWYGMNDTTKADLTHKFLSREKKVLEGKNLLKGQEEYL